MAKNLLSLLNPGSILEGSMAALIEERLGVMALLGTTGAIEVAKSYVEHGRLDIADLPGDIANDLVGILRTAEDAVGRPLLYSLLVAAMGLEPADLEGQAAEATKTISSAIGFAAGLPILTGYLGSALEAALGENAPTGLLKALERLGDDLGINFFIGTVLENVFDAAVRQPLEEAIAEKKRPARLQSTEVRALLKAKVIDDATGRTLLARLGYPDDLIDIYLHLDDQLLPVGDLQNAFLEGILDEGQVRERLVKLGFQPDDVDLLVQLYLQKVETEGGSVYKSVARTAFRDGHISEGQFRDILTRVNTPPASIDLEVAAIQLEQAMNRHTLTASQITKLWTQGSLSDDQARSQLASLGYDDSSINELLTLATNENKAGKVRLTAHQIAMYQLAGVLTEAQAYNKLLESGMRSEDAALLSKYPSANGTVFRFDLNPAIVLSAYKEGVISQEDAAARLKALNVDPASAALQLQVAAAEIAKGGRKKQTAKDLSVAEIEKAYENGLASEAWTFRELQTIGYTDKDASLLMAIWYSSKNKDANGNPALPDGWEILA